MIESHRFVIAFRRWLVKRTDNYQQNLKWLLIGFGISLLGLFIVLISNYFFADSLEREIAALIGMIVLVIGLIPASIGYLGLGILRLLRFLTEPIQKK